MAEFFNVVFSGEISGRADPAAVRANVGKLFNANDTVLDKLFSGQPIAVKKMTDRATAMRLRALMKQAGAEARIVQVDEEGRPVQATAPAVTEAPVVKAALAGTMAARVETLAEQHAREELTKPKPNAPPPPAIVERVETWAMYPVGSLLSIPRQAPSARMPVITGISMAAVGSDVLTENERPVVKLVQVDISGMSMAAVGSDVLNENEKAKVVPVKVDISSMSMAPVGAALDEIRPEKKLVNPDISHIKLADN
jgi:hypothetical protein